jgi:tRNA(His) 5'-end guanylyltransferase
MVARSLYSHKELHKMGNTQLQEMIFQKGINWNTLPTSQRRGRCIVKKQIVKETAVRSQWTVDNEIPIFSQDKSYIEQHVYPAPKVEETVKPKEGKVYHVSYGTPGIKLV